MKKIITSIVGVFVLSIMLFPLVSTAQINPPPEDVVLQAQIASLLAQIKRLQEQLAQLQGGSGQFCHDFNTNLKIYSSGDEVTALQTALTKEGITLNISGSFDRFTETAVKWFQEKYSGEVLTPSGLTRGTGFVGVSTRAKLNQLYRCGNSGSSLRVISPNGGESWQLGTTQTIRWNAPQYFRATYADISLVPYYPDRVCTGTVCPMEAQQSMRYPYQGPYTIANSVSINQNYYSWPVGRYIIGYVAHGEVSNPTGIVPNGQYKIKICETGTSNCDTSDNNFTITDSPQASIFPAVLNPAVVSEYYRQELTIDNASSAGLYLAAGELPPGLQIISMIPSCAYPPAGQVANTCSGQSTILGTPTTAGYYTFTISNRNPSASRTYTLRVSPSNNNNRTISVISPNGGETWSMGSARQIIWNYLNATLDSRVDMYLLTNYACPTNYSPTEIVCVPNGERVLDKDISASAIYNWVVGTDTVGNYVPTGSYKVKICVAGTSDCDTSNASFTITN